MQSDKLCYLHTWVQRKLKYLLSSQGFSFSAPNSMWLTSLYPPCPPGQIHQREQEIAELKQKIAEVMAVMPSLSYSSDGNNHSPVAPHYSSKFMDNSPSSLDPNASVYQPLKKWLWRPHSVSDRTFSLSLFQWRSQFWLFVFQFTSPWQLLHSHTHTHTETQCTQPLYICVLGLVFGSIMRTIIFRGLCTIRFFLLLLLSFGI